MSLKFRHALLVPILSVLCAASTYSAELLSDLDTLKRDEFFASPPGAVGIATKTGCNRNEGFPPLTYVRMLSPSRAFWGISPQVKCLRILINHKAILAPGASVPTYLAVKIVGLYEEDDRSRFVARRTGSFTRNKQELPVYGDFVDDDSASAKDVQEKFESLHRNSDLAGVDGLVGRWHGVPAGGNEDTWSTRRRLHSPLPSVTRQTIWRSRVVDYRLYRFTPFDDAASPGEVKPLDVIVYPTGASALFVKLYSPEGADYSSEFVLLLTNDRERAKKLGGDMEVTDGGPFARLLGALFSR